MLFAVWIGVGTVTSYFFGRFSETFGHERVLRMGYAVSCVGVVALAFLSSWYLMLPVILLYGGAVFLTYPAVFAVISGATNEEERGTAFGLLFGFQLGGGALVVALCGAISDILEDPSYSFIIVGILSFASLAALPLWHRR
jgi:MFS family permease